MNQIQNGTSVVARCSHGGCAEVTKVPGGTLLTSTLGTDRGRLFLDGAEFVQFVDGVRSGQFDDMYAAAQADAAALLAAV